MFGVFPLPPPPYPMLPPDLPKEKRDEIMACYEKRKLQYEEDERRHDRAFFRINLIGFFILMAVVAGGLYLMVGS